MSRSYNEAKLSRPLHEIAEEIEDDWDGITPAAAEWLEALSTLDSVSDPYYQEDGRYVVAQFLAAAKGWRGEIAAEVKAELRGLIRRW